MENIAGLDDLINRIGKGTTDMIVMEYFMLCTEKARLLDKVMDALNSGCTLEAVKDIVKGDYNGENIYDTDQA